MMMGLRKKLLRKKEIINGKDSLNILSFLKNISQLMIVILFNRYIRIKKES